MKELGCWVMWNDGEAGIFKENAFTPSWWALDDKPESLQYGKQTQLQLCSSQVVGMQVWG